MLESQREIFDKKAEDLLLRGNAPDHNPVPGVVKGAILQYDTPKASMTSAGAIVLWISPAGYEFATHWYNKEVGGAFTGHYSATFTHAVEDFMERVKQYEKLFGDLRGSFRDTAHPAAPLAKEILDLLSAENSTENAFEMPHG